MQVIKIGAIWCSGCLVMKPRWEEIEKKYSWLKTSYCDVDKDQTKIKKYKIGDVRLPIFIFLDKENNEFLRLSGEHSKKEIIEIILKNKNK